MNAMWRTIRNGVMLGSLTLCGSLAMSQPSSPTTPAGEPGTVNRLGQQASGLDVREKLGLPLPLDLLLTDADGNRVQLGQFFAHTTPQGAEVEGKPAILAMVYYTCPVICNATINTIITCLRDLETLEAGRDFNVLFVSFDERDTLAATVGRRDAAIDGYKRPPEQAKRGIQFFVGEPEPARQLAAATGFQYRKLPNGEFSHPIVFLTITPEGKIARYHYGFGHTPLQLRLALLEAGRGVITPSPADRLLAFCYMFDPNTGRYALSAIRLMQAGGVVTVVGIASFIGWMLLSDAYRRRRQRDAQAANAAPVGRSVGRPPLSPST